LLPFAFTQLRRLFDNFSIIMRRSHRHWSTRFCR
jgi:hypothetical protein